MFWFLVCLALPVGYYSRSSVSYWQETVFKFPATFLYGQCIQLQTVHIWTVVSQVFTPKTFAERNQICLSLCSALLNKALFAHPSSSFSISFTFNSPLLNMDEQSSTQYFKSTVSSAIFNGFSISYLYFTSTNTYKDKIHFFHYHG